MILYLDTCALSRLSDELSQPRILAEQRAIIQILDGVAAGKLQWNASTALRYEIEQNPDGLQRIQMLSLLPPAASLSRPTAAAIHHASHLVADGFGRFDALHLALASQEAVDWLITTDDRFIAQASRLQNQHPPVINPVDFVQRRFPWLLPNP